MPDRVDVPALLRYASGAVDCHCEEQHGYGECCKAKAAYLDRLAEAVESGDWGAALALLRGEAPHA